MTFISAIRSTSCTEKEIDRCFFMQSLAIRLIRSSQSVIQMLRHLLADRCRRLCYWTCVSGGFQRDVSSFCCPSPLSFACDRIAFVIWLSLIEDRLCSDRVSHVTSLEAFKALSSFYTSLFYIFFKFCIQTDGHRELKPVSLRSRKSRVLDTEEKTAEKQIKDKAYQATKRMIRKLPKTSGDFSQSIEDFAFVPSCLMNSLSAAAYPKRPVDWTNHDLNLVLEDGNKMYREAMANEGNPEGSRMLDAFDVDRKHGSSLLIVLNIFFLFFFSAASRGTGVWAWIRASRLRWRNHKRIGWRRGLQHPAAPSASKNPVRIHSSHLSRWA